MATKYNLKAIYCFIVIFSAAPLSLYSQEDAAKGTALLDRYVLDNKLELAATELDNQISYFKKTNNLDSLAQYAYYVGKIEAGKTTPKSGMLKAETFVNELKESNTSKKTQYIALMNLSEFYDEIGENKKSYSVTQEALTIAQTITSILPEEIGKIEYNLGTTAQRLGNNDEAKNLFKQTRLKYESSPTTPKRDLSKVYNATAVMLYLGSKLDSAEVYFRKSADAIKLADGDKNENLLDATVIDANVMLVQYLQGNISTALQTLEGVVRNYNTVIKNAKDENTIAKAERFNANATTNLAVIYSEVGNIKRSKEILEYVYNKRKKVLEPNDSQLANNLIQIGQSQISLQNFDEAIASLSKGVKDLGDSENDNLYWRAAGLFALAEAYNGKNEVALARENYNKSEMLFEKSLKSEYDPEFLNFLRNKSHFLSENNQANEAIKTARKGYDYIIANSNEDYIQNLKNIENLTRVYFNLNEFENARIWAEKGINLLDRQISESKTDIDSILITFNKPAIILLKAKSEYELQGNRDTPFLFGLLDDLSNAVAIFEKRKTITTANEEVSILLAQYNEVTAFIKKINLELYNKTNDEKYLNATINYHESSIYNRIRTHLNIQQDISFSKVPKTIIEREKELKQILSKTLDTDGAKIQDYFDKTQEFNKFLDTLKQQYPDYYRMRYETILESLDDIQAKIPANTTVVRYLFIEKELYVLVITPTKKSIVPLSFKLEDNSIAALEKLDFDAEAMGKALHVLYDTLWEPIENRVSTQKVVIIPDGSLFNLSFEMLTPQDVTSFAALAKNSLLNKHTISYNYSLLLINKDKKTKKYTDNFIAFAPEFTSEMKDDYQLSIKDSLDIDKTYLTLLPQPFSAELASTASKTFNGDYFLNKKSTENVFKNNAKEHKIIHIGTHAESNNIRPELSRLIFAKSEQNTEDNSLYTYEIYNTNLSSNLSILTACETGKPTYQPGEGMISLAHAFNYAGSESMLTSLWKIDEKSSTEIVAHFYDELAKGLPKDLALKNAKKLYLKSAKGRTLAPQYWAGLVLIGDTSLIELSSTQIPWFWILVALILLVVLVLLLRQKNN